MLLLLNEYDQMDEKYHMNKISQAQEQIVRNRVEGLELEKLDDR